MSQRLNRELLDLYYYVDELGWADELEHAVYAVYTAVYCSVLQ